MFEWKSIRAEGAVFDLDATLIDSMEIWREIDEEFFAKRGMRVPEGVQVYPADTVLDAIAALDLFDRS